MDHDGSRELHELPVDQLSEKIESCSIQELTAAIAKCSGEVESRANSISGYRQRIQREEEEMELATRRLKIFNAKLSERTTNIVKTAEQLAARGRGN